MNRLLEALWKTVRKEFESKGLDTVIQMYEKKICPSLENCWTLEAEAKQNFGTVGINFEDMEMFVKAKEGIKKLVEVSKEATKDTGSAAILVKCIILTFMDAVLTNIEKSVNALDSLSTAAQKRLEELKKEGETLGKNYWEYSKATKFVGVNEKEVKAIIADKMKIVGNPTIQGLESDAKERKDYLENISSNLNLLEKDLATLRTLVSQIKEKEQ